MDPLDYGVGKSPRSVATADFRDIGVQDLAVANSGSNDVSIFLGNGNGTFQLVETVAVGKNPYFVTTGDFNGDGIPDLAVANAGSTNVSILLGHGDGSFGLPQDFAAGSSPVSIAVGDFRGKGVQDLAVADAGANTVSILLGNGDGTFGPPVPVATGGAAGANAVAVGDFNQDGHLDLVVANGSPTAGGAATPTTVSVLLGKGDGSFGPPQKYTVGANPVAIAVGDFRGKGIQDLAVANNDSDNVSILLGKGDGTFAPAQNYAVGRPESIAVGDFNGDGIVDVMTANRHCFVSVLLGNGDGTFQLAPGFWAGTEPVSLAVGDFNGDGRSDLAVAQIYSNQVSILLNNSPQPDDGVSVVKDIVYYNGPYSNPQKQDLDVYIPASGADFPVVFLAYGGGFRNGDKSRLSYLARSLAREGIEVVAVNYRLTDGTSQQVVFPGHEVDMARAFTWTYGHIAEYGGDPENIFLMGHSSGGHLVSLLATDPKYLADQGLSPGLIRGVIGVSGAFYDLRPVLGFEDVFGDVEQRWEASPLKYVDGTQPPFLVLYAQFDTPYFAIDGPAFCQALINAGSEAEIHMIPDRDHPGIIGRAARPGDLARQFILQFIAEHTGAGGNLGPMLAGFRGSEGKKPAPTPQPSGAPMDLALVAGLGLPSRLTASLPDLGDPGPSPMSREASYGMAADPGLLGPGQANQLRPLANPASADGLPGDVLDNFFADLDGSLFRERA
jgi:acetyl esterase/lipase